MDTESSESNTEGLKLRARSLEDLTVLSAFLQDAVVSVGDMTYLPRERRFAFMANRFLWEEPQTDEKLCHRVRTGIHFDDVLNVSVRGIPQKQKSLALDLLAVEVIPSEGPDAIIFLVFAGDGMVRLDVDCIECHLTDVGPAWPTRCRPRHPVVETSG